ncbi:14260_t:CDS:2 [Funneliformis geosporum]|nr:14260_t:CDS:2 [Funneliformis geosporum]
MRQRFKKPKVEKEEAIVSCYYCSQPSTYKTGATYLCSSNESSINANPAPFHVYLTPRKRGKTDHKAQNFLERIYNNEKNVDEVKEVKQKDAKDWEVKEYAVFYNAIPRIFLIDLFSFKKKRGAIDADVLFEEIVFDEAIPIDQEFLRLGEKDEQ